MRFGVLFLNPTKKAVSVKFMREVGMVERTKKDTSDEMAAIGDCRELNLIRYHLVRASYQIETDYYSFHSTPLFYRAEPTS